MGDNEKTNFEQWRDKVVDTNFERWRRSLKKPEQLLSKAINGDTIDFHCSCCPAHEYCLRKIKSKGYRTCAKTFLSWAKETYKKSGG